MARTKTRILIKSMVKAYAFYFPQFYAIEENNRWWGEGFTDWELVKGAVPLVSGQLQPRRPKDGFYNQSEPKTIAKQAKLARNFGVSGFNIYHYWFDGAVLLDKPLLNLSAQTEIDIEYMLTWANESWTRQWVGKPNEYLIEQKYSADPSRVGEHYKYLRTYFHDPRYVKVAGKPVFCIYRPEIIPELNKILLQLNELAKCDGFSGLHFMACRSYDLPNAASIYENFSGIINFNPRYAINRYLRKSTKLRRYLEGALRLLPERIQSCINALRMKAISHQSFTYSAYVESMHHQAEERLQIQPTYPSVFPNWDNTARYGKKATFFTGSNVNLFAEALKIACGSITSSHQEWIFLNAWNEWSEAAYLEPDTDFGTAYLEVLKAVIESDRQLLFLGIKAN